MATATAFVQNAVKGKTSHKLSWKVKVMFFLNRSPLARGEDGTQVVCGRTERANSCRYLFERSELLIDTPHKKNLRVCPRARVKRYNSCR